MKQYEKLTKKEKRKVDAERRNVWSINPTTKIVEDKKKKNNKRACRSVRKDMAYEY